MALQTISDAFTGGYDATLWDAYKDNAGSSVAVVADQLVGTIANVLSGEAGLVTKIPYNLDVGSLANIDWISTANGGGFAIYLCPTKQALTGKVADEPDWYRYSFSGGDAYSEYRVAGGAIQTIGFLGDSFGVYELNMPATGDEVRYLYNTTEKFSDVAFRFSRNCYISICATGDDTASSTLDNFNATYEAGVLGATITSSDPNAVKGTTFSFDIADGDSSGGIPAGTTVDIDGNLLTILTYPASGTGTITCTADNAGLFNPTGVMTYTDASGDAPTAAVNWQPEAGYSYINTISPLTTNNGYLAFGYTSALAPVTTDQQVYETVTQENGLALTVALDTAWTIPLPPSTQTVNCYNVTAATGVHSAIYTATWVVSGAAPVGYSSGIVSNIVSNIVKNI